MTRKIITGVIAAILLVTIAVFAAEKVMEKTSAEKARAGEQFGPHDRLLDQLVEAYKANNREKMGEIINKMQERREKMREFVKLNRWHQWAQRRMMRQMGFGWGQRQQMAGQGSNRGWAMQGPRGNCGWAMRGQGPNRGCPMAGGCGQMPCQQGGMGMGNCMPQQNGPGQMPGCERGLQKNCTPGQDVCDMEPRGCNMPRRERQTNVPPPEWGW
jgi:hypothetical protein